LPIYHAGPWRHDRREIGTDNLHRVTPDSDRERWDSIELEKENTSIAIKVSRDIIPEPFAVVEFHHSILPYVPGETPKAYCYGLVKLILASPPKGATRPQHRVEV
jgi:hypothetical protein